MRNTYCRLPWNHLFLFPDGAAKLCCLASGTVNDAGQPLSVNLQTIDQIRNSPYMLEIRRKMATGEPVEECSGCYESEQRINWSYRIASNDQWLPPHQTVEAAIEEARLSRYVVAEPPAFIQLNLGNLCNLKCRMCNSTFSSQIERDPVHGKWAAPLYQRREEIDTTVHVHEQISGPLNGTALSAGMVLPIVHESVVAAPKSRFAGGLPWYEADEFLFGEILGNTDNVRELYFTGGEPLLNPKVDEILDFLIDRGCTGQVRLQFNSNCTKVTDGFVDKLAKFAQVKFSLSLDGEGATYEYIRYPASWAVVSRNVRKLLDLSNTHVAAVAVLQIYNALTMVDLCRFCDSLHIPLAFVPLLSPPQLRAGVMPKKARLTAAARLRAYAGDECPKENLAYVQTAIGFLETEADLCTPETLREFMLFTNDLDRGRRQDFCQTHPELLELIEETGFVWTQETLYAGIGIVV